MNTLTITECHRLNNTESGNPRYRLTSGPMLFYTAPDSQAAHNLPSSIYPGMTKLVHVLVTTNSKGEITAIQEQD